MTYLKYIVWVVLAAIAIGAYFYPVVSPSLGSAAGSTFSTAKVAAVDMSPATASATSTSLLNTDASARWITKFYVNCTGVGTSQTYLTGAGLSTWTMTAGTSSSATQIAITNLAGNLTLGTTTSFSQNASSTVASAIAANTDLWYWPAGTYLQFTFNATNTAACIVGANYDAS